MFANTDATDFFNRELNSDDGGGNVRRRQSHSSAFGLPIFRSPHSADPRYMGQVETQSNARDDGSQMPEAAAKYLGYKNDPEWRSLDEQRNKSISGVNSPISVILDRFTGGLYSRSKINTFEMAGSKMREIEKRYYDAASINAANAEHFDYSKPETTWNPGGYYEQTVRGTHGTTRSLGETSAPQKLMTTSTGEQRAYAVKPGGRFMEEDTKVGRLPAASKYIDDSGEVPQTGAFAGGVAAVEPAMKPLGMDPKLQSEVDENAAQAAKAKADEAKALAEAKKAGVIPVGPGETPLFVDTRTYGKQAPMTPAQMKAGNDPTRERTYEEDLRDVQETVKGMYSGVANVATGAAEREINKLMEQRGWDMQTRKKREPGTSAAPPSIGTPGKRTKVAFDKNGNLVETN